MIRLIQLIMHGRRAFISYLFDQTGCFLAGGGACMKLHSKFVWERFATAIKVDRIPLFDIRIHLQIKHGYLFGNTYI